MCSVIFFNQQFFARNMDISFDYQEKMICIPKNYILRYNQKSMQCKYAIMGIGHIVADFPLLAEGLNEKGLCIAALALKQSTQYFNEDPKKINLTSYEIIPYILANFSTILEVKEYFKWVNITNKDFNDHFKNSPLHWIISDRSGSIVIEQCANGLKVYDNPYQVLTNEPTFDLMCQQINDKDKNQSLNDSNLIYNFTSKARFKRGYYLNKNAFVSKNNQENLAQALSLINQLYVVKGCKVDENQKLHYSVYQSCIDCATRCYYYKNYMQLEYKKFALTDELIQQSEIFIFELI